MGGLDVMRIKPEIHIAGKMHHDFIAEDRGSNGRKLCRRTQLVGEVIIEIAIQML